MRIKEKIICLILVLVLMLTGCNKEKRMVSLDNEYIHINTTAAVDCVVGLYIVSNEKIDSIDNVKLEGVGVENVTFEIVNDTFKELNEEYKGLYINYFSILMYPKTIGKKLEIEKISYKVKDEEYTTTLKTPICHEFKDKIQREELIALQVPCDFFSPILNDESKRFEYIFEAQEDIYINEFKMQDFLNAANMEIFINEKQIELENLPSILLKQGDIISFTLNFETKENIKKVVFMVTNWIVDYTVKESGEKKELSNVITFLGIGCIDHAKMYIDEYYSDNK